MRHGPKRRTQRHRPLPPLPAVPRWCICAGLRTLDVLAIDVLMHHEEILKPTSTGHLIQRIIPGSRRHVFDSTTAPSIRHLDPAIRAASSGSSTPPAIHLRPDRILPAFRCSLLDASWAQAGDMARTISGWGRRVSLPMSGKSRYWLRSQQDIPGPLQHRRGAPVSHAGARPSRGSRNASTPVEDSTSTQVSAVVAVAPRPMPAWPASSPAGRSPTSSNRSTTAPADH
ncbi:MAG: hypothetical protein QM760_02775 [Nibricoccus sp.]